jgi:hypothetical protein
LSKDAGREHDLVRRPKARAQGNGASGFFADLDVHVDLVGRAFRRHRETLTGFYIDELSQFRFAIEQIVRDVPGYTPASTVNEPTSRFSDYP